ncbi:hypothetical protein ACIRRH_15505 [Kitasatospora sp. NPDC101235]|uniref:hypothetical protein n=1 Tax=Kitasatospora sp. NPDC101235 TaxID=3364101 RepID=UPI0037F5BB87
MAVIAGGSVTAAALTSGNDKPAPAQQVAAEVSPTPTTPPSPTATATAWGGLTGTSPTAWPSELQPPPGTATPHVANPAAPATKPGQKKETPMQQPIAPAAPADTQPPAQPSAGVGQNPGGTGTVDNGAPPSKAPAPSGLPTGDPFQQHP